VVLTRNDERLGADVGVALALGRLADAEQRALAARLRVVVELHRAVAHRQEQLVDSRVPHESDGALSLCRFV